MIASSQGDFNNVIAAGAVIGSSGGASVTNAQPASDTLRAKMPLTVHKAIDTRTLDSGNPAGFTTGTATTTPGLSKTLTVRLDNPNSVVLTGAAFTDSLPTGLAFTQ